MKALLLLLLALAAASCRTVPFTGRSQVLLVSEAEEVRMGEQAYAETLKSAKLSSDRAVAPRGPGEVLPALKRYRP